MTHPVVLDAEVTGFNRSPYGFNVVGFEAKTRINHSDFGLTWNTALETGGVLVSEEVPITLDIEAIEKTAQVSIPSLEGGVFFFCRPHAHAPGWE